MTTLIEKIEQNQIFKFVKDNLSLLVLLPSLLGGLRQFVVLLYNSPTLIQYFSFSQIAIDGLETISHSIYVFLLSVVLYKFFLKKSSELYSMVIMLSALVFYIIYTISIQGTLFTTIYNISTFRSYSLKLVSLSMVSLLLATYYNKYYNSNTIRRNNTANSIYKLFLIVAIMNVLFFVVLLKPFQYNVENVKTATMNVRKEKSKYAELVYYNDSYLIYLLNPKDDLDERKFYVQKFETLFDDKEDKKTKK